MAFKAEFMQFQKRVNSTAVPLAGREYDIELKARTNIFNPVIVLNYNGNPSGWNYCKIAEFQRYYWIVSWTYDSGLWYASCAIDVLATYHDDIGDANLYVLRSAAEYDGNVVDTYYPVKSEVYNTCTLTAAPWYTNIHSTATNYLIGVLNYDQTSVGATSYYLIGDTEFRNLCFYLFNLSYTSVSEISQNMQKLIYNPMQYIVSVMWLPFSIDGTYGDAVELKVGYWQTPYTVIRCNNKLYREGVVNIGIPKHPQTARGRYLNLPPYSQYSLEFWPWGCMPIDGSKIVNASYLKCSYLIDFITGTGNLRVTALDDAFQDLGDGEVLTSVAQVGVPIQLAQTSFNLASMNTSSIAVGALGSVIENGRSWFSGAKDAWNTLKETGDFSQWGEDVRNIGTDIVTNVGSAAMAGTTEIRTSGSNGGIAVLRLGVRVNAKFMYVTNENLAYIGRPLCAFRTLKNLFGFCQVADGDIALAATAEEAQAVKRYLESGVYLDGYQASGTIVNTGDTTGESGGSGGGEVIVDDGGGGSGGSGEVIVEG